MLEQAGAYDNSRKIAKDPDQSLSVLIPVIADQLPPLLPKDCTLIETTLPASAVAKAKEDTPHQRLTRALAEFIAEHGDDQSALKVGTSIMPVPRRWERHGDLILLSDSAFSQPAWTPACAIDTFWTVVTASLGCERLAVKGAIADTLTRDAQVSLKVGQDGWVEHVDNGVRYTWDVSHCMFSAGNITEKLRVARLVCNGQVVVDLFAGIGYFTLPYLVHAKAACVHACEWNPHALEALRRNLELNHVRSPCLIALAMIRHHASDAGERAVCDP